MVQAWSPTSSTMRFTSPQSCRHFNCHVATVLSLPTSLVAASSICCVKPDHLLDASLSGERRWRRHTQPSRSTDAWQRDARRKRSNRRREWNPKVARSLLQRDAAPRTRHTSTSSVCTCLRELTFQTVAVRSPSRYQVLAMLLICAHCTRFSVISEPPPPLAHPRTHTACIGNTQQILESLRTCAPHIHRTPRLRALHLPHGCSRHRKCILPTSPAGVANVLYCQMGRRFCWRSQNGRRQSP